jgi:hypothetical protein
MTTSGDNCCPACRSALGAPETEIIGEEQCPRCGVELWALAGSKGSLFFVRREGQTKIGFISMLAAPLNNLSEKEMEAILRSADELDLVEVAMEIEKAFRSGRLIG